MRRGGKKAWAPQKNKLSPAINPFSSGRTNQRLGASFESFVGFMARREDLLIIFNGLRARRLPDRVIAVRSNLDVFCVGDATQGELLVADCKSFAGARFGQGMLTPHQRELAAKYAEHGVCSGFLVHLRAVDHVGFYHARLFTSARAGFGPGDGIGLGSLQDFRLSKIWRDAA